MKKMQLITFRKRHLQSGGYFVKTKLNTFPTTGMSASASEKTEIREMVMVTEHTAQGIVKKKHPRDLLVDANFTSSSRDHSMQ